MLSNVRICSNSSFSLMSCYLNEIYYFIEDCEYIFPSNWFGPKGPKFNMNDLMLNYKFKVINIDNYYKFSRKANFGFPYFFRNGGKRYKNTVPSKQVINLYKEFREINIYLLKDNSKIDIKSETLEFYLKEYENGI